jgi:ribose-phosphate pyrophosphokinase
MAEIIENVLDFTKGEGYNIISFPDGEKHLQLTKAVNKEPLKIIYRFANSDDVFIFMQLVDILQRMEVSVSELFIPYLMTMRCDRVFSMDRPFSLKVLANIINTMKADKVIILEPHSDKCLELINNSEALMNEIQHHQATLQTILCYPDAGAKKRYFNMFKHHLTPITCKKVRDINTGNLLNFDIEDKGSYRKGDQIVVVDDLCDGGGTFLGIHSILKKLEPSSCSLWVTHAVQKAGIEKVAAVYDRVYITNSYCDWDKENLPKNVIVHKINF